MRHCTYALLVLLVAASANAQGAAPEGPVKQAGPAGETEAARARWEKLSPERRAELRARWKRFKELSPEKRTDLKKRWDRFSGLPPAERKALKRQWETFRQLPPGELAEGPQALRPLPRYESRAASRGPKTVPPAAQDAPERAAPLPPQPRPLSRADAPEAAGPSGPAAQASPGASPSLSASAQRELDRAVVGAQHLGEDVRGDHAGPQPSLASPGERATLRQMQTSRAMSHNRHYVKLIEVARRLNSLSAPRNLTGNFGGAGPICRLTELKAHLVRWRGAHGIIVNLDQTIPAAESHLWIIVDGGAL